MSNKLGAKRSGIDVLNVARSIPDVLAQYAVTVRAPRYAVVCRARLVKEYFNTGSGSETLQCKFACYFNRWGVRPISMYDEDKAWNNIYDILMSTEYYFAPPFDDLPWYVFVADDVNAHLHIDEPLFTPERWEKCVDIWKHAWVRKAEDMRAIVPGIAIHFHRGLTSDDVRASVYLSTEPRTCEKHTDVFQALTATAKSH